MSKSGELSQDWRGLSPETERALKAVQKRLTPSDPIDDAIDDIFSDTTLLFKCGPDSEGITKKREIVMIDGVKLDCYFVANSILNPDFDTFFI